MWREGRDPRMEWDGHAWPSTSGDFVLPPLRAAAHGPAPARVQLVRLSSTLSGSRAFGVLLALHARAIAENLTCLLQSIDIEGPHQLRVSLRRLRVLLRVFKPVLRGALYRELRADARALGLIVGELRDADVVIEEIVKPHLGRGARDQELAASLERWRQEVRGRVRARLIAARADRFAGRLSNVALMLERRETKRGKVLHATLIAQAVNDLSHAVSDTAARAPSLSADALHDFRKDVKALRYAADLAAAANGDEAAAQLATRLKGIQTDLGRHNDTVMLAGIDPPLGELQQAWRELRARLLVARAPRAEELGALAAQWQTLCA